MRASLLSRVLNPFYSLKQTKVLILGNQKSGTTAIAKLLSLKVGCKSLVDSSMLWEPNLSRLAAKSISLKQIILRNKYYFARPIVKEPNLTFFYNQLIEIYPLSVNYVFVIRDPRDNIRSILNRISVPGNLANLESSLSNLDLHGSALFDKKILPYSSDHYVEQLAERWVIAANVFLQSPKSFILVRYEDFCLDKSNYISVLAQKVGFSDTKDISSMVDIPFQPVGNRSISWGDFFGQNNLDRIHKICHSTMIKLGYHF